MTYKQIQKEVMDRFDINIETCWIAHVKELNGIPVRRAWNRQGKERKNPCPDAIRPFIEKVMRGQGEA